MIKSLKIRYNSKIRCKKFLKNSIHFPHMCCGQFATFRCTIACVIHVLHALQFAEPTFLALKRSFTGISSDFPLYRGTDRPGNMLSYPILCCESILPLPMPQFLLLHVYLCVQTVHVPFFPAKS